MDLKWNGLDPSLQAEVISALNSDTTTNTSPVEKNEETHELSLKEAAKPVSATELPPDNRCPGSRHTPPPYILQETARVPGVYGIPYQE